MRRISAFLALIMTLFCSRNLSLTKKVLMTFCFLLKFIIITYVIRVNMTCAELLRMDAIYNFIESLVILVIIESLDVISVYLHFIPIK